MSFNNSLDKYQTIASRFMAAIIDTIVLIPLWGLSFVINSAAGSTPFSTFIVSTLSSFTAVFYVILMHAFFGQTLGKMLMKIKVMDIAEIPVNLGQAAMRSLPQLIPVIFAMGFQNPRGLSGNSSQWDVQLAESLNFLLTISILIWNVVNIIVALSGDTHRALHDYLAGTIVVKTNV